MVNPISLNNAARPRVLGEADAAPARSGAAVSHPSPRSTGEAADNVSLSTEAARLPEELTKGPPIDRALVDRIGEAVAQGRYPIRPDLIADALFREVRDMNS